MSEINKQDKEIIDALTNAIGEFEDRLRGKTSYQFHNSQECNRVIEQFAVASLWNTLHPTVPPPSNVINNTVNK